jgi:hypothetical protein
MARRTHEALQQTAKLHEDYLVELAPDIDELLQHLYQSAAAPLARELGIPVKW